MLLNTLMETSAPGSSKIGSGLALPNEEGAWKVEKKILPLFPLPNSDTGLMTGRNFIVSQTRTKHQAAVRILCVVRHSIGRLLDIQ